MEAHKIEEVEPNMTIKAVALPAIPMTLKKAWKTNQANLEKAGMFRYLCWIQGAIRAAYGDRVTQFIQTYSATSETARVNEKIIDFSVPMIQRFLKLPAKGLILDTMPGLTKKQHEEDFEGEFPRTPRGCLIDKARHLWKHWLKFVNAYLLFRLQKDMMTQRAIVVAIGTWEGQNINWAKIV